MVPVARRNLLADRPRLAIAVGGVAFAVLLILVVRGLYEGFSTRLGSFAEGVPADLWVMEPGTRGFVYSSLFPAERVREIAAIEGVAWTVGVFAERVEVGYVGGTGDTYVLAFDVPAVAAARLGLALPAPGEVVIDEVLARDTGLSAGDVLQVRGRDLVVAEVRDIAGAGLSPFSLMAVEDARELIAVPGYVGYALVAVEPGADPEAIAAAINAGVPGVWAEPKAAFAAAGRAEVSGTFLPIVGVLLVVAFGVGAAVVGITTYTLTVERWREYGVLKAIGASAGQLYRIVLVQGLIVGLVGFAVGVPLALAVNRIAEQRVPEFITLVRWQDVATVFAATLVMAVVAAFIPIRRVARIDPAAVFRV
jgi:putative ABC transport system permease protein